MESNLPVIIMVTGFVFISFSVAVWSFSLRLSLKDKFMNPINRDIQNRRLHIGLFSGIAIDITRQTIAYSRGFRRHTFSVSDIFRIEADWTELFDESRDYPKLMSNIWLETYHPGCPIMEITFWSQSQLQKCLEAFRELRSACSESQINTKYEVPALQKPAAQSSIDKMEKALLEMRFSREDGNPEAKERRRKEAVEILYRNYETVCKKKRTRGFRVEITLSIRPYFEREDGDPEDFGYTPDALYGLICKDIRILMDSDREKELNQLKYALDVKIH